MSAQSTIQKLLQTADVELGGSRPWDLRVSNPDFYRRVLAGGSVGLGESYMDGWWEVEQLDEFFRRVLAARLDLQVGSQWAFMREALLARLFNWQSLMRAGVNASFHYNLGNDLYRAMLDKRLVYTCGYWREATDLGSAQEAKLDLVCRKLKLQSGQRILDIGCGWGSFAKFAAERYGVTVVGVTVSQEQVTLGQELCQGLPVEIKLQDYRQIEGTFDHIVSLGMFEHVGFKNYQTYMQVARDHLSDEGLFLLHTIGGNHTGYNAEPWLAKYIFPHSHIPSPRQIVEAAEGRFVLEDWHNFGPDYDKTLMAWWHNFDSHWPELQPTYGDRFYRMWKYYLLSCAGGFRARYNQLWQIVWSKNGVSGGYKSVR